MYFLWGIQKSEQIDDGLTDDGGRDGRGARVAEVRPAPVVLEGQIGEDRVEGSDAVLTAVRDGHVGQEAR